MRIIAINKKQTPKKSQLSIFFFYFYLVKKWIFFEILLLLFIFGTIGNRKIIRSTAVSAMDSTQVIAYGDKFWEYAQKGKIDSAWFFARGELALAKQIGWKKGIAQAYNDLGILYFYNNSYDSALAYYDSSRVIREEINDLKGLAALYNKIGIIAFNRGNYHQLIKLNQKALDIYKKLNDSLAIAKTLNNIGMVFDELGTYEKALEKFQEALKISPDPRHRLELMVNFAMSYANKGDTLQAITLYKKVLKILETQEHPLLAGYVHHNLAIIHKQKGKLKKAQEHILKAIEYKKKAPRKESLGLSYAIASKIFSRLGDKKNAWKYLKLAEENIKKGKIDSDMKQVYAAYALYHHFFGNKDSVLYYKDLEIQVRKKLFEEETRKKLTSLQEGYEAEERKKDIELLRLQTQEQELKIRNKNQLILGIVIMFLLLTAAGVFYFLWQRQKVQTEKQLLQIKIQEEERNRIARELHDDIGSHITKALLFSQQMEFFLNQKHWDKVSAPLEKLTKEIRNISKGISEIIWMMYNENSYPDSLFAYIRRHTSEMLGNTGIKYELHLPETFENTKISQRVRRNIFLIFKETLNNIVKYAEAQNVYIEFKQTENGTYKIVVKDDGKGFDLNSVEQGNGLKNIRQRAKEIGAEAQIVSEPGKGTTIEIRNVKIT